MSTAAVSSTSIFQELQSFYQTRQTDLKQLGSDIQSGNLSAAQQDFQNLAVLGENGPFANSEPFSNSTRANTFNALGEALQGGNLAQAQTAFNTLTGLPNATAPATPANPATVVDLASTQPGTASTSTATPTSSIYQQLQAYRQQRTADLTQLGQDLQAGNLSAAQTDFNTLTSLGQTGPFQNGQPFQQTNRAQDFQAIGQALQSGDVASAQTAYTALAGTFSGQSQQAQTAISAYNSAPIEIVINLGTPGASTSAGTATPSTAAASNTTASTSSTEATTPTAETTTPEIVINLGPGSGASGTSTSELVINLGQAGASSASTSSSNASTAAAPELIINLGSSQSAASSGSTTPELVINLNPANSTGTSGVSDILINSVTASSPSTSTGSAPELVINLNDNLNDNLNGANGSSSTAPNETTISLANTSSGEQLTIDGAQGQNGSSAQPVTINLNPQDTYELILNLLNPSTGTASNALSVSA